MEYLKYKFMDTTGSSWSVPFWASLGATLGTWILKKVNPFGPKIGRVVKIGHKASIGALITTTLGALFIKGGTPTKTTEPAMYNRGMPSGSPQSRNLPRSNLKVVNYTHQG
jgi:hypothetical protein